MVSAAERRRRAKVEYDAYLAACPSRQLLDRISDKWIVLAMAALSDGSRRYSELSRRLAGVSQKMLTQTLRILERDGLVERTVTPSVPVRVDYELTSLGRSLLAAIQPLKLWAEQHLDEVEECRRRYDGEPAKSA